MSDVTESETFLEHYGKKGMRWGKRKAARNAGPASTNPGSRTYNSQKLNNQELKKVVERMKLEQQYTELNTKATPRKKSWSTYDKSKVGDVFVKALLTAAAGLLVKKLFDDKKPAKDAGKTAVDNIVKSKGSVPITNLGKFAVPPKRGFT